MTDREMFEKWAKVTMDVHGFNHRSGYPNHDTHQAWRGWKAAAQALRIPLKRKEAEQMAYEIGMDELGHPPDFRPAAWVVDAILEASHAFKGKS